MFTRGISLVLLMAAACVVGDMARYDNYRLYRVHLQTEGHVKIFQEIEERSDSYTFYGHARSVGQQLTIMVAAHKIGEIGDILQQYNIEHVILVSVKLSLQFELLIYFVIDDIINFIDRKLPRENRQTNKECVTDHSNCRSI